MTRTTQVAIVTTDNKDSSQALLGVIAYVCQINVDSRRARKANARVGSIFNGPSPCLWVRQITCQRLINGVYDIWVSTNFCRDRSAVLRSNGAASAFAKVSRSSSIRARAVFKVAIRSLTVVFQGRWRQNYLQGSNYSPPSLIVARRWMRNLARIHRALHRLVMPRALHGLVYFRGHFVLSDSVKRSREFSCLFSIHGQRLKLVVAEFYPPRPKMIAVRFDQYHRLIKEAVIQQ